MHHEFTQHEFTINEFTKHNKHLQISTHKHTPHRLLRLHPPSFLLRRHVEGIEEDCFAAFSMAGAGLFEEAGLAAGAGGACPGRGGSSVIAEDASL